MRLQSRLFFLAAAAGVSCTAVADVDPHAGMLRYPDVSATQIVFSYANDLWLVSRDGGQASPLASPPGGELFPRFSPDGKIIAFVGNYDGDRDLYTINAAGGAATRVTHHPANEMLCDWTPDGQLVFASNGLAGLRRQQQLFTVGAEGGLPEKLPVPYGANASMSDDGQWIAYTPHSRDFRTWKRYRGGMATDIWLFNISDYTSRKITDWEGTDTYPMWHDGTVYYLSDNGPEHRLNIWSFDPDSAKREQVTKFADDDVKFPAIGPGARGAGEIVFQNGASLYLLDLGTKKSKAVEVSIPGDRPSIRAKAIDVKDQINGADVSPGGKRVTVEARGDIWTLPAENGAPRNLTRTSGTAERDPAWSPDARWIAYFSDETGEYELYITQSDGKGETRQLTKGGQAFRFSPNWSPDSEMIAFWDKTGSLYIHTVESGETELADIEPWANRSRVSWSHDSAWIAYVKGLENGLNSIWLYNVADQTKHQVTSGMFQDTWPTFDREGDFLFLASNRDFTSPVYEDVGTTFVYANTDRLLVVPLRDDVESPWLPKTDEEEWDEDANDDDADAESDEAKETDDDGEEGDEDGDEEAADDEEEKEPLEIDIDGFENRAILIPVDRGNFSSLAVSDDGKLLYGRSPGRGSQGSRAIKIFDLTDDEKEEKTVIEGTTSFGMTADGKKLLVRKSGDFAIVKAAADQKFDKKVPRSGMTAMVEPREEWNQVLTDAWRIFRDFFYDPNFHGVDWEATRVHYTAMLDDCVNRDDVAYLIREMISELNVGHAYYRGNTTDPQPSVNVGMLGADFELDDGAYQITRIYEGAAWDVDARGPLSQPGTDVNVGDYLLAVNGVPVDTSKDPWAAFVGMGGRPATLTVSENSTLDDDARDVVVKLAGNEGNLRYRAWIEANRAYVSEKTGGRVGYIYVPDTGVNGQNNLLRQFYGQIDKDALIIDERWNGGGQIPTRFIELLNRPATNYWAIRDGRDWTWPPDSHQGPKCMLINGLAGSGGDMFPALFKQAGLGKLIGMRTWGGLVGISGNPGMIDGSGVAVPTFGYYERDGTWGIEGHGVDPDIEVIDDPGLMAEGGDPQLDAAIKQMLAEIKANPYVKPSRPTSPDRSGMGIAEQDK